MAIDTRQKRMSAMWPRQPWRGPLVDATESGFNQGNRQAADYLYSGILAGSFVPPVVGPEEQFGGLVNRGIAVPFMRGAV